MALMCAYSWLTTAACPYWLKLRAFRCFVTSTIKKNLRAIQDLIGLALVVLFRPRIVQFLPNREKSLQCNPLTEPSHMDVRQELLKLAVV